MNSLTASVRTANEESAIRVLRGHMELEGARLSEVARWIAGFHLGLVTEQDRDRHLVPAERFALLAFHLRPCDGEAGELLREVQQLRGNLPFEHVQFTDDAAMAEDDSSDSYSLAQTPRAVAVLLNEASKAIRFGHYRHAHALADVAFLSSKRWDLGDREPLALAARYWRASALQHLGLYDQALAEIDGTAERPGILALHEQSPDLGPKHPQTLATHSLRADILNNLGHDEAREGEPRSLSIEQQAALGLTHDSS